MSMEAALEEERREVEALVGAINARPASALSSVRSSSPYTPRSPVRSMLDIGETSPLPSPLQLPCPPRLTRRCPSSTGPARPTTQPPVRSMLDMDGPPASSSKRAGGQQVFSTPSSPVLQSNQLARASNASHPRHMSDASAQPVGFGPRSAASSDLTSQYQFGDIYTNSGQQMPMRVFQGNKKDNQQSSMSHIARGSEIPTIPALPGDRGRHSSGAGPSMRPGSKSRSPHTRLGGRSTSPGNSMIKVRTLSPAGRAVYQDSHPEWDMSNAYRKLSDLNRLRAGGLLANSVGRKKSTDQPGTGRLAKDYLTPDGDVLLDDSSDEQGYSSQEELERGRQAARNEKAKGSREAKSLLAAAEEERKSARGTPFTENRPLF